ncbi:hypothetical protein [Streptomyces sp. NPDC018055]|uniref:hypothetical protein n=1 Tax=Streptomyces sp. NPDC018055 TaxID=3365038 RepID=UPI003789BB39
MSDLQKLADLWAAYVNQSPSEDTPWRRVHLVHEDGSDEVLFLHKKEGPGQVKRTAEDAAWQRDHLAANPEKCLTLLRAAQLNKGEHGGTGVSVVMPEAEAAVRQQLLDDGLDAPESGFFETYFSTAKEL